MAIHRGPKIVTNGLVMNLDSASPKSYPGGGSKWNDLTQNKIDITLTTVADHYQGPIFDSSNFGSLKFNPIVLPEGDSVTASLYCDYPGALSQYSYSYYTYVLNMDVIPYNYDSSGTKVYGQTININQSQPGCNSTSPWFLEISSSNPDGYLFIVYEDTFIAGGWFDIPIGNITSTMYIDDGQVYNDSLGLVASYNGAPPPTISPQYYYNAYGYSSDAAKFAYGTADFTWEIWTKPISFIEGNNYLLDHGANGGTISYYVNLLRYYNPTTGTGGTLYNVGGGILSLNSWYNIVVSRISGTTYIYVNGVLKSSGADAHNYSSQALYLCRYGGDGIFWRGDVSVCRIYKDKGLTNSEVSQNYNALKGRFGIL